MPNKCLKKNSSRFAQMRQWKKNYNFEISSLTICDRLFTMYSNYVNQTENMDFFFVSLFLCQPPFAKRV